MALACVNLENVSILALSGLSWAWLAQQFILLVGQTLAASVCFTRRLYRYFLSMDKVILSTDKVILPMDKVILSMDKVILSMDKI